MYFLRLGMIVLFVMQSLACIHPLKETQLKNSQAAKKLLIAGKSSQFKDAIRERITDEYKNMCEIHVVTSDHLPVIDPDAYDAILLMEMTLAWGGFNNSLTTFLDSLSESSKQKVVLFMTTGDPDWSFMYANIDAITSASSPEKIDGITAALEKRLDKILSGTLGTLE